MTISDNICAPVCGGIWYSGILCIYIYTYMYILIYGTQGIYLMHNMPVVSECKLNQVDIVGEPLSTSVLKYRFQFPSLLPSFLPSLLSSLLPFAEDFF